MAVRFVALRRVTHSTYIPVRLHAPLLVLRAFSPFYSPSVICSILAVPRLSSGTRGPPGPSRVWDLILAAVSTPSCPIPAMTHSTCTTIRFSPDSRAVPTYISMVAHSPRASRVKPILLAVSISPRSSALAFRRVPVASCHGCETLCLPIGCSFMPRSRLIPQLGTHNPQPVIPLSTHNQSTCQRLF
jgi:hypothetical protein